MTTLGWTRYDPAAINHYPLTYFDLANNQTVPTAWFKIIEEGHETTLHGSNGPFGPRFRKPLRARPYPMPNFNRTTSFQDDSVDIFDNHLHNRPLVDRALSQLEDPGLDADVWRYRFFKEHGADIQRRIQGLEIERDTNNNKLLETTQFLAHARGPSRIATQVLTYAPTAERLARSPVPIPIPPRRTQSPRTRPRGQTRPAGEPSSTSPLTCQECHTQLGEHKPSCSKNNTCVWCHKQGHFSFECPNPHGKCEPEDCRCQCSYQYRLTTCPRTIKQEEEEPVVTWE